MKKPISTYIIAEIGGNHNGSIEIATDMVTRLAKSSVNAIKFQLGDPKKIYSQNSVLPEYQKKQNNNNNLSIIEQASNRSLSRDEHLQLFNLCNKHNVDYLCSAFDLESLIFLDTKVDLKYFKIPSGEIFSIDMLEYISSSKKPIILSTGMSSIAEIRKSLDILDKNKERDITILHCISKYPTKLDDVNMRFLKTLKNEFNYEVGFSDHTTDNETSITAVAMGATIIEKHVTLDKNLPGPDHQASSEIDEFIKLISSIRKVEKIMGQNIKIISEEENKIKDISRKSIVAKKILKVGDIVSIDDVTFKRPGIGVYPINLSQVLNKKVKKEIQLDHIINLNDLEE